MHRPEYALIFILTQINIFFEVMPPTTTWSDLKIPCKFDNQQLAICKLIIYDVLAIIESTAWMVEN